MKNDPINYKSRLAISKDETTPSIPLHPITPPAIATMTNPVVLLAASLLFSAVVAQPPAPHIKAGSSCAAGGKCEAGTQCLGLLGRQACVPIQTYRGERKPGLFGDCSKPWIMCYFGRDACNNGVCLTTWPKRKCDSSKLINEFACDDHMTCQDGTCQYGVEGASCGTHWLARRCLPGLRCVDPANPNGSGPAGKIGKCMRLAKGDRCLFGAECPVGLLCGTSNRCVAAATGQPCASSYVCPLDHACVAGKCQPGSVLGWAKVPTEDRARQCRTELDCRPSLENTDAPYRCLNGVCVINGIGGKCTSGPKVGSDTCKNGLVCNEGKCTAGTRGKKCNDFVGTCDDGLWCEYWNSKTCTTKRAGQKCKGMYGCPPGLGCVNGICSEGDAGAFCLGHAQCKKGLYCVAKKCSTPAAAFA